MTKLIYKPKINSPAAEYCEYAVSVFEGCVDPRCSYCYMFKMAKRFNLYTGKARVKPCFENVNLFQQFQKEVIKLKPKLQKTGLFFTFNSDPFCNSKFAYLTKDFIDISILNNIPVKILTKQAKWVKNFNFDYYTGVEEEIEFGFTLTGHDELEQGCSTNAERINAMKYIHDKGFNTCASIEPIIDTVSSLQMIINTKDYCDMYKIGLESGKKYDKQLITDFCEVVKKIIPANKIYWKKSIINYLK